MLARFPGLLPTRTDVVHHCGLLAFRTENTPFCISRFQAFGWSLWLVCCREQSEPPLSFSPGRWPPVCRNWESKGAAVKRPLAGTICWVMKFSPGTRSSTDFLANWKLRDTAGVSVPELMTRVSVTMCG